MALLEITTLALVICVTCLVLLFVWKKSHKGGRLPPGPTPLPIIGNLMQLNLKDVPASLSKVRVSLEAGHLQVRGGVIFRLSSCHLQAFLVLLTTKTLGVSVSVLEDRYLFFFFLDWITLEQVVRCVNLTWDIDWILVNGKILKSEHTLTERLPVPSACNTYQKASQANVITVLLYYYYYFILICGILYDPPSKEWSPHLALTQPSSATLTDDIHSFGNILWEKVLSQWVHCASIYSPEQP